MILYLRQATSFLILRKWWFIMECILGICLFGLSFSEIADIITIGLFITQLLRLLFRLLSWLYSKIIEKIANDIANKLKEYGYEGEHYYRQTEEY